MSLLKHILSPFVEFKEKEQSVNEEKPQAVETKESSYNSAQTPPAAINTSFNISSPTYIAASDAAKTSTLTEYQKHFDNLIEEANNKNPLFGGTDFKEFIDSKMDVQAIADEETKYKTAFNVLKRTGLTKQKLLTTGREYVNLIDNDLKEFENAYTQQYKNDVVQKEQLLQAKTKELQALSDRVTALNGEMKQLFQEITQSKDRLTSKKTLFVSAGESKKKEIQTEIQKIDQYFS